MQGMADGYFVIGGSFAHSLSGNRLEDVTPQQVGFLEAQMHCHHRILQMLATGSKISGRNISVDTIRLEFGCLPLCLTPELLSTKTKTQRN